MRLRQQGQTAFRDEIDPVGRYGRVDRVQILVESDSEIRIVPADERPLKLSQEKTQVIAQHRDVERLIWHDRVDAEAAGVGTSQTAEHRYHLEDGALSKRRLDELPAFADPGEGGGLTPGRKVQTHRLMWRAVPQHLADHGLVGEAEDVVEVLPGVLRVAACVRPAEHRDRPS